MDSDPIDLDELAAWLQLLETPRLGRDSVRKLLAAFGSPRGTLTAPMAARRAVAGGAAGEALSAPPPRFHDLWRATLAWLGGDANRRVVTIGDKHYPNALLEAADPPLLLYTEGRIELLASVESIAIVGSRHPTPQGIDNARAFAGELSRAGCTIVSGLARGIDAAAHDGAVSGAGSTIAVVGTGLDQFYPPRNRALAERIARDGLIVSEYSLGTPPLAANFPLRNRLIAGLARATLVVEAAPQSGSLITARLANEAGRDVMAIPGSIHAPQSRGCHALIKQGAKLVESVQDILDELRPSLAAKIARPRSNGGGEDEADDGVADQRGPLDPHPQVDPLLAALGYDPTDLDTLAARTGWPASELNIRLLELELEGSISRLPGQRFQRSAQA